MNIYREELTSSFAIAMGYSDDWKIYSLTMR
jgi:hypothetical protein